MTAQEKLCNNIDNRLAEITYLDKLSIGLVSNHIVANLPELYDSAPDMLKLLRKVHSQVLAKMWPATIELEVRCLLARFTKEQL